MNITRAALLTCVLVAPALPAAAQDDVECTTVADPRGGRVIRCEASEIEGSVPRPFVVLPGRSASRHAPPPLERELAREIRRTVRRSPF